VVSPGSTWCNLHRHTVWYAAVGICAFADGNADANATDGLDGFVSCFPTEGLDALASFCPMKALAPFDALAPEVGTSILFLPRQRHAF
jgi:hypothetical protein